MHRAVVRATIAGVALAALLSVSVAEASASGGTTSSGRTTPAERSPHGGAVCHSARIASFYFAPRKVKEKASTELVTTINDCTSRNFAGSLETYGRLVCLVLDPHSQPVSVTATSSVGIAEILTAPSCAGRAVMTAKLLSAHGRVVSSRTATLLVAPG